MRHFSRIFALGLLIGACPADVQGQDQGLPVTYDLQICRGSCDAKDGGPYLTGTVTLLPVGMRDRSGRLLRAESGAGVINGCYTLTRIRPQNDSYAGTQPKGYLSWTYRFSDSTLTFALYRSADAGYDVELKPASPDLAGTGRSWGPRVAKISAPRDTVIAVRRKSPDSARCPSL